MKKTILTFGVKLFIVVFFFPILILGGEKDSTKTKFLKLNSLEFTSFHGASGVRIIGVKVLHYTNGTVEVLPRHAFAFAFDASFQLSDSPFSLETGLFLSRLGFKMTDISTNGEENKYTNEFSNYLGVPIILKMNKNRFNIGGGVSIDYFLNRKINLNGEITDSNTPFQDGSTHAKDILFGGLVFVGYSIPLSDNLSINTRALLSLKTGPSYAFLGGGVGVVKYFKY